MADVSLVALEGNNPLGFLAALGALDALTTAGRAVTLRWTDELVPYALVSGIGSADELIGLLDQDRKQWLGSLPLAFPSEAPLADAKPDHDQLRAWFEAAARSDILRHETDLLCALLAEGAFDGNGKAKPTHLHFTAGQQRFLDMVRALAEHVDADRLREATLGPWRRDSQLPSLSWDAGGERIYAVRATDPSNDKRLGVPGADWLAFRGLGFYPVRAKNGGLRTTACDPEWKRSAFRWPLWGVPATRDVVRSVVADRALVGAGQQPRPELLAARGILRVLSAPIKRTDQGGYGSFRGAEILASSLLHAGFLGPEPCCRRRPTTSADGRMCLSPAGRGRPRSSNRRASRATR